MPFALVTGASGGIGWALGRELASRKHDVILVARSEAALQKNCEEIRSKYGVQAQYLGIDLSVAGAAAKVVAWLQEQGYAVDILVNNAGYAVWGPMKESNAGELGSMMRLNMITLAEFCKALLPGLEKHPKGYILNVASTAAYQAVPTLATYAATKAFVLSFSRALKFELKVTSVSVTCLSPGPTSSGFMDRAKMEDVIKDRAEKFTMSAEKVARIAIDGMFAGKTEIVPGFTNWLSARLAEIAPKGLVERIAANLYKTGK